MMEKTKSVELYHQYQKMVQQATWKTCRRFHLEFDECMSQANLIFCEAINSYNPDKASFSTHLYIQLKKLANYANHEKQIINSTQQFKNLEKVSTTKYQMFEQALETLESALDLSHDAQIVLDFIISRDWEIPGIKHLPRKQTTARWMKEENGWTGKRSIQAWEEVRQWYRAGNHVLQEA